MAWHRRYQLVQKTLEDYTLRIVPYYDPPKAELQIVRDSFRKLTQGAGRLEFEFVEEVKMNRNGKMIPCRSLVAEKEGAGAK